MHLVYKFLDEILLISFCRYQWTEKLSDFRLEEKLRDKSKVTKAVVLYRQLCGAEHMQVDLFWKGESNRITKGRGTEQSR